MWTGAMEVTKSVLHDQIEKFVAGPNHEEDGGLCH